ncbi:unnamed protein product, partial [marine sediment metagenome]
MPIGIYPRTETHSKNLSRALTGRKLSKEHIENVKKALMGNQNVLGKHWKLSKMQREYNSLVKIGVPRSEICRKNIRKSMMGKNNFANWMQTSKGKYWLKNSKHLNTDIEKITEKELNICCALDIINFYEKQKRIKRYFVDFYIPELKLIIECNSKWWHSGFAKKYKDMKRQ